MIKQKKTWARFQMSSRVCERALEDESGFY